MTDQRELVNAWAEKHADVRILELPATLEDGAKWTVRMAARVGADRDPDSRTTWEDVGTLLREGVVVDVVAAATGGRYVVGHLLARRTAAMIELERRSFGDVSTRLGARWVKPKDRAAHHIWADALGFSIDAKRKKRPAHKKASVVEEALDWHLRPGEDLLLHSYWRGQDPGGRLWVELPMPDDGTRKIDGLIVHDGNDAIGGRSIDWDAVPSDAHVEVVEAKATPDPRTKSGRGAIEMVIGQAAAARAGVAWRLGRPLDDVGCTVLTGVQAPSSLIELCSRLGIAVAAVEPSRLLPLVLSPDAPDDVAILHALTEAQDRTGVSMVELAQRALRAGLPSLWDA